MLVGKVLERCRFIDGVGLLASAFAAGLLTFEAPPFPNAVPGRTNLALHSRVGCFTNFLHYHLGQFFLFELFCSSTIFSWTG